jgi:hypothetical protein
MLECSKASGPETQSEGWSWPQQAITCSLQGDKFFFRARLIGAAKCVLYLSWSVMLELFLLLLDFEGKSEKTTHAFFKPTCTHTAPSQPQHMVSTLPNPHTHTASSLSSAVQNPLGSPPCLPPPLRLGLRRCLQASSPPSLPSLRPKARRWRTAPQVSSSEYAEKEGVERRRGWA